MKDIPQIIGLVSAGLTTTAFLPQVIKTWRTRSTADLSPLMFSLFCIGISGWLIYGFLVNDLPIILANIVTICLAGIIMFFIIIPDRSKAIEHIAFYAKNPALLKSFYCDHFKAKAGTKYVNPAKGFTSFFLTFSHGTRLELMHQDGIDANETGIGNAHLAISVGSKKQVTELTRKLVSEGTELISNPRTTGDGYFESVVRDPEGNTIEITV